MRVQQPSTHFARQSKRIRAKFAISKHTADLMAALCYGEGR